ncbi:hypothetical protein D9M70_639430 [compost metagenome]
MDEGVQQLLLPGLQALALDAHGGGTGHGLQEGDAVGLKFFQVGFGAAVGDQQYQYADGFLVSIAQANTDQMDPRRVQCPQDALQIGRLFEAQGGDEVV